MKTIQAPYRVRGGVHPVYRKDRTRGNAIVDLPPPALLRVSMTQHLGAPARPVVKKGDTVARGQLIGEAAGFISAAVHAPTSGTVKAVQDERTPAGSTAATVQIEPDGEDRWVEGLEGMSDWAQADAKTIVGKVGAAGIAGMGGAGFPTHVKLSPPPDKPIDTLILNGAECEPYLTADHRLMIEHASGIVQGLEIVRHVLGAGAVRVAIEDNKPEAIAAMEQALAGVAGDVALVILETGYPQGAEKQQIYAITGREVPSAGLPMDVGCLVENVGTALSVRDAVLAGRPLTERVTTVTGTPVRAPGNVRARLGTPYADLLAACGGGEAFAKIIAGGPMMGLAQPGLDATTTKTASGLLFLAPGEIATYSSMPCIGCGRCIVACPMLLMPAELSQFLEAEDYEGAEGLNVMDCIECGCCSFSCPAHRPLVQHMKQGKAHVMLKRRAAKK